MMIVRKFVPSGSLRDLIYRQKPQTQFLQKYGPPRRGLDAGTIALYGRQVLEALKFLSDKGFVLGTLYLLLLYVTIFTQYIINGLYHCME